MPRGNHAKGGLRSHRRRIGKHLVIAPWIIITVVAVVLFAGLAVTWGYLVTRGCSGSTVTATVLSDQSVQSIIDKQGAAWNATKPTVDGHCAKVEVLEKDSASVAAALAPSWNTRTDGPRPDAWVPESSLWMRMAASRHDAAAMLPDRQPSLARSPAVIAMPTPMAKALQSRDPNLTWHDIATEYAGKDWVKYGHDGWGGFKVAVTDPTVSTAGLHALTAMTDADNDGDISPAEQLTLNQIWQVRSDYQTDTDQILQKLSIADPKGESSVLHTVSAFPALEQDVISYDEDGPRTPLTAVYPKDGSADADFPYLVIGWSHGSTPAINPGTQHVRSDIAQAFLKQLRGADAHKAFQDAGYRDANRKPGPAMTAVNGVRRTVPTVPRSVVTPDSISATVSTWTAISRQSNVLIVMDVSSSMGQEVQGTGKTKLKLAADATGQAIARFGPGARLGLWDYASNVNGKGDSYEQIVPVGKKDDTYQGDTRFVAIRNQLGQLSPVGEPTLFDTALAAYKQMRDDYEPGASNQIVIITGDGSDSGSKAGLADVTSQLAKLSDKNHPLPIVTVGYGTQVDLSSLQAVSQASGGRTYTASSPTEISRVLLTALFSGAPPAV
ncbi:MAG TPA: substrate-binding domain-containing protein [Actinocatenispora sp.]